MKTLAFLVALGMSSPVIAGKCEKSSLEYKVGLQKDGWSFVTNWFPGYVPNSSFAEGAYRLMDNLRGRGFDIRTGPAYTRDGKCIGYMLSMWKKTRPRKETSMNSTSEIRKVY